MTSIFKQVEVKIVGGHSIFQKLQKDKQKACLKLYDYQDCRYRRETKGSFSHKPVMTWRACKSQDIYEF